MAAYWILHLAFLLLSAIITSQQVLAARQQDLHTISIQSLLSSSTCSSSSTAPVSSRHGAGSTLQIVPSACLRTGDGKTVPDNHHYTGILRRDRHRVRSIHRRLTGAATTPATIPARLGLAFNSLEYVVTVGIGTPPLNFTVLFDTGSDLTWVQCLPCSKSSCYHQEEPLFDPSKSLTYVDVPCGAPECHIGGVQQTSCGATGHCQYSVKYGDESVTRGSLAEETFTLSPLAPPATGVVFGCSHEYISGFNGSDMGVAGLLGLGRGDSSVLSQTRRQGNSGGVFSYCLPSRGSSTGYLTIGDAPQQSNMSFMPLITTVPELSSMYVVNLAGISVNGAAVRIPASAFSLGAVIDSGTVVTHMPAAAYYPLRDEFRRHMGEYKMLPEGSMGLPMDTCYDVTGQDVVTAPRVALEFGGGARIDVDASGVLLVFPATDDSGLSLTLACLAFAPTKSPGLVIVGNVQQRAYNIVFDVEGGRIGFGPNGCS